MSDEPRLVRRAIANLPESPPGLTPDAVGRALGFEKIASLGLNEGVFAPFPRALEALGELLPRLNRYPARGSRELVDALAARHGIDSARVFVSAGADAAIGYVSQAVLEPGDEIVTAWPSFPSFVTDALKRDAVPVRVPLVDGRIDLDGLAAAVTARTRIVFVATPNNPTGLALARAELDALAEALPPQVLLVVDEAYVDYLDPDTRLDAIDQLARADRPVLALRTFSKLYGLAGLRVGYAVGPAEVVDAMRRVQRGYDVSAPAQVAALASLDDSAEVVRRRDANRAGLAALEELLTHHELPFLAGSEANFVLVEVAEPDAFASRLLEQGVAVQHGAPFGAPGSVRISVGTEEELALLDRALVD